MSTALWVEPQQGWRFGISPSLSITCGAPIATPSQPAASGPPNSSRKPCGASRMSVRPVMPHAASAAASTALRAASPACSGLAGVPNCPFTPAAMLTARLIARAMPASSRPPSQATPAAVPMQPTVEVACQPAA